MNTLFPDDKHWTQIKGDTSYFEAAFRIFSRHYSFRRWRPRNNRNGRRFIGPGQYILMLSTCKTALFVWRKEKYRYDGQQGIECSIFRNESGGRLQSSALIREAEEIAWRRWPGQRLFTFVNPRKVASPNPGYCFKMAGWRPCGHTKAQKLLILEKQHK